MESSHADFGKVITSLKANPSLKAYRAGWNGKNMFIVLKTVNKAESFDKTEMIVSHPCFWMFTAQQEWQPGWLASQADMLAEDWTISDQ